MKLSILIPMYNAKNYIGNCLESLLHQDFDYNDYEIIIMDDGSTDESVSLVESYQEKYSNIVLYKETNVGAYSTRNKLLKLAKGDYIYNLDADDYLVHNCLNELIKLAINDDLDIIGFKTKETTDLDKTESNYKIENTEINITSGIEFIEKNRASRHEIWWYFVKRDFLKDLGLTFNSNEYNADVVFTLQLLLKAKKFVFLPIEIHRYVQTENSLMRSKNFEILSKRIEYLHMMIINKSKIINGLKHMPESSNSVIMNNLNYRRDMFAFFNIINMIRNPFSKSYLKQKIVQLKEVNAYPIKDFIGKEYGSLSYKTLNLLINRVYLLYPLITIKNLFIKTRL